jgi:NAD(P)-dependent dehydrogenase (short-subunit alcohol dehydrogenase family)
MNIERGMKAFITGAASGIGRSTALAMAATGCRLFLTDVNADALQETVKLIAKEGGEVCKCRAFDLANFEQVKAFAVEVHGEFGAMDVVMNIAGIAIWGLVEDLRHEHWMNAIQVNLMGPIHVIESFLPEMIRAGKGGHLVNVSSAAGLTGAPWHGPYATAKWGLVGVSEVLRYDLMQHGIGVTVVCPGAVATPMRFSVQIVGIDQESEFAKNLKRRFSKRAISPDRVAQQIMTAIRKNQFLVITSFDIKLLYFLKRKFFPLYHYVMIRISRLLNQAKQG